MAVRSDHVGGLGTEPGFSRLAERGLHLVTPLAGDALRESIEQPAELAGLRLEHGLVELLVRDCEGEPGGLPLLSHALAETWRRRDGNVLTVEGYRATGGIRGAVARSADRLYDTLPGEAASGPAFGPAAAGDPVPRRRARPLPGVEPKPARRRRTGSASSGSSCGPGWSPPRRRPSSWPTRRWPGPGPACSPGSTMTSPGSDSSATSTSAAEGWESLGRPVSELYRGARLDTALEWQEASAPHLTELEQQFLADSVDQASSETRAIAERARRDARQNRRLRSLLGATAILLVASMVVGYVAIRQREQATSERQCRDRTRELAAAANANVTIDPERSVLLALAAVEESRSGDGTRAARSRGGAAPRRHGRSDRAPRTRRRRGPRLEPGWPRLRHRGSPELRDRRHPGRPHRAPRCSPSTATTSTSLRSRSTTTEPSWPPPGPTVRPGSGTRPPGRSCTRSSIPAARGAWGPSFSPDGSYFAAAWPDDHGGVVRVLDLGSGRVINEIDRVPGPIATSFDPGGPRLAVASDREPIAVVVDVDSGDELFTATGHFAPLRDVAWSPDGSIDRDGSPTTAAPACSTPRPGNSGPPSSVTWRPSVPSHGAPNPAEWSPPAPTARPRVGP